MVADEDSESRVSMLQEQQHAASSRRSGGSDDEASPALESGLHQKQKKKKQKKKKKKEKWKKHTNHQALGRLYFYANLMAMLRCFFCLPLVGLAGYMLSPGVRPTVLPFAAYTAACVRLSRFHSVLP